MALVNGSINFPLSFEVYSKIWNDYVRPICRFSTLLVNDSTPLNALTTGKQVFILILNSKMKSTTLYYENRLENK
jgi:hypothetical protein